MQANKLSGMHWVEDPLQSLLLPPMNLLQALRMSFSLTSYGILVTILDQS